MAFFFKKKIKAREFAAVLGHITLDPARTEELFSALGDTVEINSEEEKNQVLGAIPMLRLFAVDCAVTTILGKDSPEKNAVLDHFYSDLKSITTKTTAGDTFYDAVKEVLLIYATALQTPHEQGPFYSVGKEFAKLCGKEHDFALVYLGSTLFTHTEETIRKMLKKTSIKI